MFKFYPRLGSAVAGELKIVDLVLYEEGTFYICLIEVLSSEVIEPISWQIYKGL